MKILTCFQNELTIIRLRFFDPVHINPEDYIDLEQFSRFRFNVLESFGVNNKVIISKLNDVITKSTDHPNPLGIKNTLNIQISPEDTASLIPNPPTQDKIRSWNIAGENQKNQWIVLDRGYFYIDSMAV